MNDDEFIFAAVCHKCKKSPSQRWRRHELYRLLDKQEHIEVYCIDCDMTRFLDAEERMKVRLKIDRKN